MTINMGTVLKRRDMCGLPTYKLDEKQLGALWRDQELVRQPKLTCLM